jgi:hypothetical protein
LSEAKQGAERRTSTRVDTHQHVIFSDNQAMGPLRTGTAVDRSTGGLRIVTAFPEAVGSTIQIELQNSGSSGVVLLEGRVMHVAPLENGQYAMGIRLASRMLRPAAPSRVAGGAAASATATVPPRRLDVSVGGKPQAVAAKPETSSREPVMFRRVHKRSGAGSWAGVIAILALVVILVLLILEAIKDERQETALQGPLPGMTDRSAFAHPHEIDPTTGERARNSSQTPPDEAPFSDAPTGSHIYKPGDLLARVEPVGSRANATGPPARQASLRGIQDVPQSSARPSIPLDKFVAQLEYATDAFARGEESLARSVLRRSLRDAPDLPAVWQEYARTLYALFASPLPVSEAVGFDSMLTFVSPSESPRPIEQPGIRIDVDAEEHALRVWRGSAVVAEFPVGLGREGATPTGNFRIANKLTDPAWHASDGRIVPAGDPRNPIGAQWMGLAGGDTRAGIGIHPTAQFASIGHNDSSGCVRMRPADAAALYRLVPIGTPVSIHD